MSNIKAHLIIPIIIFFAWSCQHDEIKNRIIYNSSDNDMADIKLIIDKDHTFKMDMVSFPELGDEKEKSTHDNFRGTWILKGEFIQLKFKTKGVTLKNLFDPKENKKENVELINPSTVAIRKNISGVMIWGVLCERE